MEQINSIWEKVHNIVTPYEFRIKYDSCEFDAFGVTFMIAVVPVHSYDWLKLKTLIDRLKRDGLHGSVNESSHVIKIQIAC